MQKWGRFQRAGTRFVSSAWCQLSGQVVGRNGPTIGFWKITRYCESVVSAGLRLPLPSTVRPRSSCWSENGPSVSDVDNGNDRGSAVRSVADGVVPCTRKMALPSSVGSVLAMTIVPDTVTVICQQRIGSGGWAGLPRRALAREALIAQVEIARLLRATIANLERRAKRGKR